MELTFWSLWLLFWWWYRQSCRWHLVLSDLFILKGILRHIYLEISPREFCSKISLCPWMWEFHRLSAFERLTILPILNIGLFRSVQSIFVMTRRSRASNSGNVSSCRVRICDFSNLIVCKITSFCIIQNPETDSLTNYWCISDSPTSQQPCASRW